MSRRLVHLAIPVFLALVNKASMVMERSAKVGFVIPSITKVFRDVNECLTNPCHSLATCQNTPGSYKCACKAGIPFVVLLPDSDQVTLVMV